MKRTAITNDQFFFIIFVSITSLTFFSVPVQIVPTVKQDLWLSMLIGAAIDIYVAYVLYWLGRQYPGQSLVQYSETILGKIGKVFGLLFVLFFFVVILSVMWLFSKFLTATLITETPGIVVSGTMTICAGFAAYYGLGVIGRVAQLITAMILLISLLLFVISIRELDITNLLPQFEYGLAPAVKGAVYPGCWFGICLSMGMMIPHHTTPKDAFKVKSLAVLLGTFIMTLTLLYCIAVLGPYMAGRVDYPIYTFTRVVHLVFLERFDIMLMLIYIFGAFITFATLYYVMAEGAAQLFGSRTHRSWIIGFAVFITLVPLISVGHNMSYSHHYFKYWFPVFALAIEGGLTTILFVIALIKKRAGRA
ncbi:hypothetical protein EBB07_18070 [Paenibacillaceae bacterium]|nr:hypothetical protein EBB07_18070 [Paenibacillaceae bacterium]